MNEQRRTLEEAKAKLDVAVLWRTLGLPGNPTRSCRCPLHEDTSASFSVYVSQKGTLRWKCFAGCGSGGPVELLSRVLEIGERESCRRLLEMAEGATGSPAQVTTRNRVAFSPLHVAPRRLQLPVELREGDHTELQRVAALRGLSWAGLDLASSRGLLWFAFPRNCPAWIVTDQARINAQARKMDGGLWEHIGNKKAWTLPGSRAPWPIGTLEAQGLPFVMLVEGGPDLLAAHHFIISEGREADTAAVGIMGSANNIPDDALRCLAGKRVRIYPDADQAGRAAAIRWAEQLEGVGCSVDAFDLAGLRRVDGEAVKDLNDLALVDADSFEAERADLLEVLPR